MIEICQHFLFGHVDLKAKVDNIELSIFHMYVPSDWWVRLSYNKYIT